MNFKRLAILIVLLAAPVYGADELVYFGAHVRGDGRGFWLAHLDTETGTMTPPTLFLDAPGPGYFVFSADNAFLYATHPGNPAREAERKGGISAYAVDRHTGALTFLNSVATTDGDPCFVGLDHDGHHALVANYGGATAEVFAIRADGRLGERTAIEKYTGHGPNPDRQTSPHPHSMYTDPSGKFALIPDLGLDRVHVYKYDEAAGTLSPATDMIMPGGAGPRHLTFSPDGKWLFVISEMAGTISAFSWDSDKGLATPVQSISTIPKDFTGMVTAAEVVVDASGKYLYATTRYSDTLAVFSIEAGSGKLALLQQISTFGHMPRNFAVDPGGRWLIVTNHDGNDAQLYAIDPATGQVKTRGKPVEAPTPYCVRFLIPSP